MPLTVGPQSPEGRVVIEWGMSERFAGASPELFLASFSLTIDHLLTKVVHLTKCLFSDQGQVLSATDHMKIFFSCDSPNTNSIVLLSAMFLIH